MATPAGKFVKSSYDENNAWGIAKVEQLAREAGYEIIPKRGETYGIDIAAIKKGEIILLEAEVKINYPWTSREDFPFPTVSFLSRKKKWEDTEFFYVIVCRETGAMVMCKSSDIFKEEYRTIKNIKTKYRSGVDITYNVPKDKCKFIPAKR
jgi:malate/lactate dehydrogenase